ncbi:hypothetical protein DSO57_1009710 [Entomophthora muscae]|uniref:Uncharacterized protein n=1 Tax=Entomophthora muscae TaxID=34485 RepID=A0ACC2UFN8_9FUNG|nr:hypothetical protein DSO57_1009710 [Entomophthora muscae]
MGPLQAFSLDLKQACTAACSLFHTGKVAMHTILGPCPGYTSKDLYSFLSDFGLFSSLMESMEIIGVLVNQFIQPALVHHQLVLRSQSQLLSAVESAMVQTKNAVCQEQIEAPLLNYCQDFETLVGKINQLCEPSTLN